MLLKRNIEFLCVETIVSKYDNMEISVKMQYLTRKIGTNIDK